MKKIFIIIVLVAFVLSFATYLVAMNNNMLLKPKNVVSNYIQCQKSDYRISTDSFDSSIHKDLILRYIDSSNGYNYYINSLYNGKSGEIEDDYFIKKKGNKIVAAFNLKELNLVCRNDLYIYCGFYYNGNLYFTMEGTNSIFCIDDCLTDCKIYFTPQKFGKINAASLCIAEDVLYYITDSGSLVKYNGTEEIEIKKLPKVPSAFEDEYSLASEKYTYVNVEDSSTPMTEYSYYLNHINGEFYFGMENKLFRVDEDGNAQYLDFKIPSSSSGDSHIYRIEPYKNNSKIIAVSFFYVDNNPEGRGSGTIRYLINPENDNYIKSKQRVGKWSRCLSGKDFQNYVDNLRSMASNND